MKISVQRLRNLTTGILHTKIEDIYKDIENLIGEDGIMTHHLPVACDLLQPHLRKHVTDVHMWDGIYNPTYLPDVEYDVPQLTADERTEFFEKFGSGMVEFWNKVGNDE